MSKTEYIILLVIMSFIVACSGREDVCIIKAEFKNLNEGELYLYTLDGSLNQMDTVTVRKGVFTYELNRKEPGFMMLLFPNMSEQVIFLNPGHTVEIEADATHLRNMSIKGGDDNKLMTAFRNAIASLKSESEIRSVARDYIIANPQSIVSMYLLQKYFMQSDYDDVGDMENLIAEMRKAQPENGRLVALSSEVASRALSRIGADAPNFQVLDSEGDTVRLSAYKDRMLLLAFWASWNTSSRDERMKIKTSMKDKDRKENVDVLSISLDEARYAFINSRYDSIPGKSSCDYKGYFSPVCRSYDVKILPQFILIDRDGKVVAREGVYSDMERRIDKLIEKYSQTEKK